MLKKRKRKILPISTQSFIRTYTYYAYTMAMINNEYRTGKLAADIDVQNYDKYKWEYFSEGLDAKVNGENVKFLSGKYNKNMNTCIYRDAKEIDELRIKINYQQFSQPWSSISIFLAKEEDKSLSGAPYLCKLGNFCRSGVYYRIDGVDVKINKPVLSEPKELILRKNGNLIQALAIDSDQKMILLHSTNVDQIANSKLKMAILINLNDNNYYHWLFSNFIQLDCDINDDNMKIKYFYGLRKNWNYNNVNFYLDYIELDWDDINRKQSDRLDYIKECVDKEHYVELSINQYYIKSRAEYSNVHFFHQNLIYGYDDMKKELLLLGFDNNGYPELTTISYSNFLNYYNFTKKFSKIYLIKYNQDGNIYNFDITYVREMLKQYLEGSNSSMYLQFIMQMEHRTYGIKIYDEWMKEEWLPHFVSDKRILHLFHEHKLCMKERIEFLYHERYINNDLYNIILPQINEIILLAEGLKYIALKSTANSKNISKEKFYDILTKLKEAELTCYNNLLDALENH